MLLASIGARIRRLGDLEVPTGKRGLGDEPSSRLEGFGASGLCWASGRLMRRRQRASTCSGSRMNSERATARKGLTMAPPTERKILARLVKAEGYAV